MGALRSLRRAMPPGAIDRQRGETSEKKESGQKAEDKEPRKLLIKIRWKSRRRGECGDSVKSAQTGPGGMRPPARPLDVLRPCRGHSEQQEARGEVGSRFIKLRGKWVVQTQAQQT